MAHDLRITWKGEQFLRAAVPALNKGLTNAALVMANQASADLSAKSYPPASTPGEPPARDTGALERSIAYASPESLGTPLHAAFGTGYVVGRWMEFGKIITAKKGKYLAVPTSRALARLVQRKTPTATVYRWTGFETVRGSLRKNPLLQYIPPKHKGGNYGGMLVLKKSVRLWHGERSVRGRGAGTRTIPKDTIVFVLKKRVVIQPRPWIKRAAMKAQGPAREAFVLTAKAELVKAGAVAP